MKSEDLFLLRCVSQVAGAAGSAVTTNTAGGTAGIKEGGREGGRVDTSSDLPRPAINLTNTPLLNPARLFNQRNTHSSGASPYFGC